MSSRTRRRAVPAVLILGLVAAVMLRCGVPEDEFLCEEAAARLQNCCSDVNAHIFFCRHSAGCGSFGLTRTPDFSVAESRCILDRDCATLRASNVCTVVGSLVPNEDVNGVDCSKDLVDCAGAGDESDPICPPPGPPEACARHTHHAPVCP